MAAAASADASSSFGGLTDDFFSTIEEVGLTDIAKECGLALPRGGEAPRAPAAPPPPPRRAPGGGGGVGSPAHMLPRGGGDGPRSVAPPRAPAGRAARGAPARPPPRLPPRAEGHPPAPASPRRGRELRGGGGSAFCVEEGRRVCERFMWSRGGGYVSVLCGGGEEGM